jgi:hypothetical protein
MTDRPLYVVHTQPWEHGLELSVDGVGVTQTHNWYPSETPEVMVRDLISLTKIVPADSFDLVFIPPVPE